MVFWLGLPLGLGGVHGVCLGWLWLGYKNPHNYRNTRVCVCACVCVLTKKKRGINYVEMNFCVKMNPWITLISLIPCMHSSVLHSSTLLAFIFFTEPAFKSISSLPLSAPNPLSHTHLQPKVKHNLLLGSMDGRSQARKILKRQLSSIGGWQEEQTLHKCCRGLSSSGGLGD